VSKYSANPDAAYKLIAYECSKEVDTLKAATGNAAVRQSTYANWETTPTTQHFGVVADCLAISSNQTTLDAPPITSQLADYANNQMSRAILKELDPEEALQMIDDEWTKLLKDAGLYG
jgi:ABC-type glycerol-3-phosphate transport system substrate-binding protein